MIGPPVFQTVAHVPAVRDALGTDPIRVFPFGQAPQGVATPYATWQVIGGAPLNYMSETPDIDTFITQLDIWGDDPLSVQRAAIALRDAIESVADIARWGGEGRDPKTSRYRISFDTDWTTTRNKEI